MIFCFWTCWNVKISYKFRHFLRFEHKKSEQNDLNMLLNTFYYIDIWYSYISGKFHWLILYILLVMNDFVFLNLLKYQNFVQISAFFVLWTMVNILAKNAYFFPPPSSQGPYFFPVFAASHDTNMSQICGRSARSAKFLPFLPHIWQIALKIDLKQCNLGKFSLFCVSNFRVRSLFLPHFSRMLISSPLPRGGRCWPEYIPLSKIEQKVTQEMQWIMNYMLLFRIWDQKSTTTINCIQNDSVET